MAEIIRGAEITLHDLKNRLGLRLAEDDQFFREWQTDLPEITDMDRQLLDRIKAGYLNLIEYPPTLEYAVKMAVLGPLLNLAGFYLAPFYIRSEVSVSFSDTDKDIVIEGKIDVLVLREQLWIMVIESKRAAFSIEAGLPQILAYMSANPHPEQPCFGMITTGGSFVFIKLVNNGTARYATSAVFELRNPGNDLYEVFRILKRLGQHSD